MISLLTKTKRWRHGETKTKRERERGRQTDRPTDRQTDRQTDTDTEGGRGWHADIDKNRKS